MKHSYWITDSAAVFNENAMYVFKKTFSLSDAEITAAEVEISAEARYTLFINGNFVSHGPCKAPGRRSFTMQLM